MQVPLDAILCRIRILSASELQSQKVLINRHEHEQIMELLMDNEAALERVRHVFSPLLALRRVCCCSFMPARPARIKRCGRCMSPNRCGTCRSTALR